jgi:HK97 family phage major capsid protein
MDKEELVKTINDSLDSFKKSLPAFVDKTSLDTAFADFKVEVQKSFGEEASKAIASLEDTVKKQGETLAAMKNQVPEKKKSFRDLLVDNKEAFDTMIKANGEGLVRINTTVKTVSSANATSDTDSYQDRGVGQIQRGMPYMRDLFPKVTLGSNTHDTVSWWEQLAVTNNAGNVAEIRTAPTSSNLTWVKKTIDGRRIMDWTKISLDSLKDIDFVMGEIQGLINKNMKLKENTQLISGLGTGNEIAGINSYAQDFVTTNISIVDANLIDLLAKMKTQIAVDMLGGAMPNYWLANNVDVDNIRLKKDKDNNYLFPAWSIGGNVAVNGMSLVENPLIASDTLLVGDFNMATLYVWDDLMIEIAQIEDDKKTGLTTIIAYQRENLRVKDVDVKSFVKVDSIAAALSDINLIQA